MRYLGFGMPILSPPGEKPPATSAEGVAPRPGGEVAARASATAAGDASDTVSTGVKGGATPAASPGRKDHLFGDLFVQVSITLPAGERDSDGRLNTLPGGHVSAYTRKVVRA